MTLSPVPSYSLSTPTTRPSTPYIRSLVGGEGGRVESECEGIGLGFADRSRFPSLAIIKAYFLSNTVQFHEDISFNFNKQTYLHFHQN